MHVERRGALAKALFGVHVTRVCGDVQKEGGE